MENKSPQTVLEFNGTTIRFSRSAYQRKTRVLTHCFSFEVGDFKKNAESAIRRELKRHRCRPENLILALPRYAAISRFLRLPSASDAEIKEMVGLRIFRESGRLKDSNLAFDYKLVGRDSQGYALVSVFLVQRERLKTYLDILKRLNIFPHRVTLNTQGLLNWALLKFRSTEDTSQRVIYLLNADHGIYDFNVFANGFPVFGRTFTSFQGDPYGFAGWLAKEVKVSLELFRRACSEFFKTENTLYITGAISNEEFGAFRDAISGQIENIALTQDPKNNDSVSYASVQGLALENTVDSINMLPQDLRAAIDKEKKNRMIESLALGVFVFLLVFSMAAFRAVSLKISELDKAHRELAALASLEADLKQSQGQAVLDRLVLRPHQLYRVFGDIYQLTPANVFLTSFEANVNGSVILSGFSPDLAGIFDYLKKLKEMPILKDVRLEYTDVQQKEETRFNIRCQLKK